MQNVVGEETLEEEVLKTLARKKFRKSQKKHWKAKKTISLKD